MKEQALKGSGKYRWCGYGMYGGIKHELHIECFERDTQMCDFRSEGIDLKKHVRKIGEFSETCKHQFLQPWTRFERDQGILVEYTG